MFKNLVYKHIIIFKLDSFMTLNLDLNSSCLLNK